MYGRMQSFPKFFYNKQVKVFGDGRAPGLMQLGPVGQRGVRRSPRVCQQRAKGLWTARRSTSPDLGSLSALQGLSASGSAGVGGQKRRSVVREGNADDAGLRMKEGKE